MNDFNVLINETLNFFKGKTKEEQIAALKKEGWSAADINYIINGQIYPNQIKKTEKKGKVGSHEILLSVDKRGEILKNLLKDMSMSSRVKYLEDLGLSKESAEDAAKLVDELAIADKKFDE